MADEYWRSSGVFGEEVDVPFFDLVDFVLTGDDTAEFSLDLSSSSSSSDEEESEEKKILKKMD